MLDLAGYAAFDVYRAIRAGQDAEAGRRSWSSRLRDLRRIERDNARKMPRPPQQPSGPRKLTGAHTPWI
jgi:hypothetical protein